MPQPRPGSQDGGAAASTVLVRAERLYVRPGEVVEDGAVLIQDGRIVAVGKGLSAPEGARELSGRVVCAGFVDAWSVFGLEPDSATDERTDMATRTVDGVDPYLDRRLKLEVLGAGVTGYRLQVGTNARSAGIGAFVRNHPDLPPEQTILRDDCCVSASVGLTRGGRAQDVFDRLSDVDRLIGSLNDAKGYLEDRIEYRHELEAWRKAIAEKQGELEDGFKKAQKEREKEEAEAKEKDKEFKEKKYKEDKQPKPPRYDAQKEVLARVVDGELPLVVEAHRAAELRALLEGTAPFDRLRLVVAGGTEAMGVADELAERRVPVIVWPAPHGERLSNGQPRPDEYREADPALAAELEAAGVEVLLGSGGAFPSGSGELPLMASLAVGYGLDPTTALAALTTRPARVLDVSDSVGTLERGKQADLLVLDGEPLASTTRIRFVICAGQVVVEND
ncbi:MAG TPA: amidohydrolase family protein [Planctomycetota bacterium]|nr:amidohydrolase family protein [Planctomycetota bacterium]